MFRDFSQRRVVGFVVYDWLATQFAWLVAVTLYLNTLVLPVWLLQSLRLFSLDNGFSEILPILTQPGDGSIALGIAIIWPFVFILSDVYDGRRNSRFRIELYNVLRAIVISSMLLFSFLFFYSHDWPNKVYISFIILDLGFLFGGRLALYVYRSQRKMPCENKSAILIVGAGPLGRAIASAMQQSGWNNLHVSGYLDDDPQKQGQKIAGVPVLGTLNDIDQLVTAHQIRGAVMALPIKAHERLQQTCQQLQALSVQVVVPDIFALSFPNATLQGYGNIPLVDLGQPGIHGWRRWLKRSLDIVVATLLLIISSPIFMIIAVLIRRDSAGPILYRQKRVGENGRYFDMLKFRSMYMGTDSKQHQKHMAKLIQENLSLEDKSNGTGQSLKLIADPRITPIGRWIRKTSLDELPQFINVLRGEMSLVGPRPPIPYEVELYQKWHRRRLEAPPGITGIWQVTGRNCVSFDEMVHMDIDYIEKQSIWLDLKLLLQTPLAMINGKGAG